ncbi:MAG: GNAT family N-acetyltransferase [Rhizobiaceae bacterium]|jgi:diamine N-acetyltransferase|nr:GNAT family N-acetyltransferase [Rhizobiaceae bacterium]
MLTVTLRPVQREDVRPLLAMEVAEDQKAFVASNALTLSQAPYETGAHVFGIWHGETRVGLLAAVDNRDYKFGGPGDDPNSAFLWRLLIAREHQGRGFGRAALLDLFEWARSRGLPRIFTSVVPGNAAAAGLYQSLGFAFTGRVIEDEAEMVVVVPGLP